MRLSSYLNSKKIDEAAFAVMLGVSSKAVRHWLDGIRIPRSPQMQKIIEVTNGAVMPNDFLRLSAPVENEAAE